MNPVPDAVLLPPAVDERLDLGRHLDLLGPRPRVLFRQLVRGVDAELAADELTARRVVERAGPMKQSECGFVCPSHSRYAAPAWLLRAEWRFFSATPAGD